MATEATEAQAPNVLTESQEVHTIHVDLTSIVIPDLGTIQSLIASVVSSQVSLRGLIQRQGSQVMALADDVAALTTVVSNLNAAVSSFITQANANFAALQAALASSAAAADPAVQAAVAALQTDLANIQAAETADTPPPGP